MSLHAERCLEHDQSAYTCTLCAEGRGRERKAAIEQYWRELKVLPLDDPTPPQEYPR